MTNLYSYYFQVTFIAAIVINHMTEVYLARRQQAVLRNNLAEVPAEFKNHLTLEEHQKAMRYAGAKLNFAQLHLIWEAAVLFYWFPFRGIEKLMFALPDWGLHREVLLLVLFMLAGSLINLPWSLYSTFVLEEKFGFNRTTWKIYLIDRMKGAVLGAVIGLPLLYALIYLFQKSGSLWWMWSFIFLTGFQFILVWLYPTYIAPLFNKFRPLEENGIREDIEGLVTKAGFQASGVFVMDASKRSSHGNAYFTGFGKSKRVVFFDTLLTELERGEVLAILAHELGHLKLKHIPKSLALSLVLSFAGFWIMGQLAPQEWFYRGHFIRHVSPGVLLLIFTQAIPLYTFWFSPFGSWLSRKREFEADAYAAKETKASNLISGLLRLYKQNASPVVTDTLYSNFYHSHPPALERIKKLQSLE